MHRRDVSKVLLGSAATGVVTAPSRCSGAERVGAPSSQWPRTTAESKLSVDVKDTRYPPGHVGRYGATGDWDGSRGTDNTKALRAALSVCESGGNVMYVPAGQYRISGSLRKEQSFTCPAIRGDGAGQSRIVYPDLGAEPALYVQGGSGRLCGTVIEGIGFDGSPRSTAIEVDGQDGLTIRDCDFGLNAVGVRLHNGSPGAFTEYTVAESCHFDGACATALQFLVTHGNDSFNGSGLRNCTMVLDERSDECVYIGEGALPYHAPLSFQVWTYGTNKTVIRNDAARAALFHGTITLEAFGRFDTRAECPTLATGRPVYLVGGFMNTAWVNFGTAVLGARAAMLGPESGAANGQILIRRHPWSCRFELSRGANALLYVGDQSAEMLYVEVSGANYDCRFAMTVAHEGYGGHGFVQPLGTLRQYDGPGYGLPTFSVDRDGRLVIDNPNFPRTGITAYVDVVPFGPSRTAYVDSAVEYM